MPKALRIILIAAASFLAVLAVFSFLIAKRSQTPPAEETLRNGEATAAEAQAPEEPIQEELINEETGELEVVTVD